MCIYRYIVQYDNGVVRRAVASFQGFIAFWSENQASQFFSVLTVDRGSIFNGVLTL